MREYEVVRPVRGVGYYSLGGVLISLTARPSWSQRLLTRLLLGWRSLVLVLATSVAVAGEIPLTWTPVAGVAGYRVYTAPSSGGFQAGTWVLAPAPPFTLTGLPDCVPVYVAVKAVDAAGNVSGAYSNEVSGLPSIRATLAPARWPAGVSTPVVASGANFASGLTVTETYSGITVSGVQWVSCSEVRFVATVGPSPTPGLKTIMLRNPDGTYLDVQVEAFTGVLVPDVTGVARSDVR